MSARARRPPKPSLTVRLLPTSIAFCRFLRENLVWEIMPVIKLKTLINAPIDRVFDLARSIDLHADSMTKYDEKAVNGVTKGLIGLGESVTWEAVHFGVRQKLTSIITLSERPDRFQDKMVSGAFSGFTHDHFLEQTTSGTLFKDIFDYSSPLGPIGVLADILFLEKYMTRLLNERNQIIKRAAESDEWKRYLP